MASLSAFASRFVPWIQTLASLDDLLKGMHQINTFLPSYGLVSVLAQLQKGNKDKQQLLLLFYAGKECALPPCKNASYCRKPQCFAGKWKTDMYTSFSDPSFFLTGIEIPIVGRKHCWRLTQPWAHQDYQSHLFARAHLLMGTVHPLLQPVLDITEFKMHSCIL